MAKKGAKRRPPKLENLMEHVHAALDAGQYVEVHHAEYRSEERLITREEYKYVLRNGRHEKSKDKFEEQYNEWNYAVRGKTVDERNIRVIVSFDVTGMLVITLIDLDKE